MSLRFPDLVRELENLVGSRLVAEIADVNDARAVKEWAQGTRSARPPVPQRLRTALRVALFITKNINNEVAQAWFDEPSPRLDDCSPIQALQQGRDSRAQVLAAARAFVASLSHAQREA